MSLDFIQRTGVDKSAQIIDIGGGASTLVDHLLAANYEQVTVLDVSAEALAIARQRLGEQAHSATWIQADITQAVLPEQHYDLWHDRAVFHFLNRAEDRQRYIETLKRSVKAGGHVIMATFALDGPQQCSGLDVSRYSVETLMSVLGHDFRLVDSANETHNTPFGTQQKFIYCYCRTAQPT